VVTDAALFARTRLSPTAAAKLLGVPPRTLARWLAPPNAATHREMHPCARRLLAAIADVPGIVAYLEASKR
jgi:hypothetical protein